MLGMPKPVIADADTLLSLLREAPASRVVRFVRDEDPAICECEDGDPLPSKSRGVVAWIEQEGSAWALLNATLDAAVAGELSTWEFLPLRYGPYCSTWTMPENPHAPKTPGSDEES